MGTGERILGSACSGLRFLGVSGGCANFVGDGTRLAEPWHGLVVLFGRFLCDSAGSCGSQELNRSTEGHGGAQKGFLALGLLDMLQLQALLAIRDECYRASFEVGCDQLTALSLVRVPEY